MINQPTHKLTDEEFLEAYIESKCSCSKTASYIMQHYNIYFTRQSVHRRAKKFPGARTQMMLLDLDQCDDKLLGFADDEKNDIRLRVRLYLHIQNTIHKSFGAVTHFNNAMRNRVF